jgi:DNA polymerase-3 subunit delta'
MTTLTDLPAVSPPPPWFREHWSRLAEQQAAGHFPHALMLVGGQYTGKSRLALALARLLLCAAPESGLNCGSCHACDLSASGSHGDFLWVQPEDDSRFIKVDQVRGVLDFAHLTSAFGERKIVVLEPADSMNMNAFNALLKVLEEPSAGTYLVLVCNRVQGVPATIRSRCQMLRLPPPDAGDCLAWLDHMTADREASTRLLELADGRPMLAEALYRENGSDEFAERRLAFRALLADRIGVAEAAALWGDTGAEEFLDNLVLELQWLLRGLGVRGLASVRGREAFVFLDELVALRRSVKAGANPSRELMKDSMLSKFHRLLGGGLAGDNIRA